MGNTQIGGAIHHLCRTLLPDGAEPTDAQLLTDYLDRRDEASLATVVHRHGPMVWGVCRRVLGDHHAAEDAFQAVFLVLVRKAASVAPRERLANWLYGVAHQTALKARATAAKRNCREKQVTEMPEPIAAESNVWPDLQPVLDEELSRLPDKYRAVIVLCDLEDRTRAEAARQLGVPEGSVAGWLARGRAMLAERLTRRGVTLSAAALAGALSRGAASASVPPSVTASTIHATSLFAADPAAATGVISDPVAALTEGVLRAMFLAKLKIATAVLLVALLAGSGVGLHAFDSKAAEPPAPGRAVQPPEKTAPKQADIPKAEAKAKDADKAKAMTKLQGRWKVQTLEISGNQLPQGVANAPDWTISDGKVKIGDGQEGKLTIDPAKDPAHIDIELASFDLGLAKFGDLDGAVKGIYQFDGDKLTICLIREDGNRPTKFLSGNTVPGFEGAWALITFERENKDK